jgi:hypothetical protein
MIQGKVDASKRSVISIPPRTIENTSFGAVRDAGGEFKHVRWVGNARVRWDDINIVQDWVIQFWDSPGGQDFEKIIKEVKKLIEESNNRVYTRALELAVFRAMIAY